MYIYVRLTTGPVPPIRPIPTTGPILTTGLNSVSFLTNGLIFSTTRPTFKRHFHKWAYRNVLRYVSPRHCDEELIEILVYMYIVPGMSYHLNAIYAFIPVCMGGRVNIFHGLHYKIATDFIFNLKNKNTLIFFFKERHENP